MIALVVVLIVAVFLWNAGFNVLLQGWLNAFGATWADSPMMGVILIIGVGVAFWLISLLNKL